MPRTLRAAVIGCGKIAANHAQAVTGSAHAELVAVSDTDPERARAFAALHGNPKPYGDTSALLAETRPDVVHICTPHPTHEALVVQAALAGAHILCEKPLAVDLAAADRMTAAADRAGVRFGVLFQRRFWPAARRIREAIDAGQLGTPVLGECTVRLGRDSAYYEADAWRGRWDTEGGGVLMNQGIHYLDLLQWYLGPARDVTGRIATFRHGAYIEVEDSAVATIRFASGALATVRATTTAAPGLGARIEITGDNGHTVSVTEFPEGTPGVNDIWTLPGEESYERVWDPAANSDPPLAAIHEGLMPYHAEQIDDFLRAVAEDRDPLVTGAEARKALEVVQAIYTSSRTGETVTLSS
ncbi:Gfo/Idh/MocA family protein [Streptomyces sp. NPDC055092]